MRSADTRSLLKFYCNSEFWLNTPEELTSITCTFQEFEGTQLDDLGDPNGNFPAITAGGDGGGPAAGSDQPPPPPPLPPCLGPVFGPSLPDVPGDSSVSNFASEYKYRQLVQFVVCLMPIILVC